MPCVKKRDHYGRTNRQLKRAQYTVTIVFLFLESLDVCIARVNKRVLAGGHGVPAEDIVGRFYRSKNNFWRIYKNQVDHWNLFYNSEEHIQEVAVGEGVQFTVTNEALFELFMQDVSTGGEP